MTLQSGAAPELIEALRQLPGVEVVADAPASAVIADGAVVPVEPRVVTRDDIDALISAKPAAGVAPLVLVVAVLDEPTAARLEDAGVGYVDAARRAWLPGHPLSRTALGGRRRDSAADLRGASLRLVQLLADHPSESWTQRSLATRGGSSPATASTLLRRLEADGLLERRGGGRSGTRHVTDPRAMRRWLFAHGRLGRDQRLACFVRDPSALPARAGQHRLVLTGAAAAERIGLPVLTSIPRATYRVDAVGEDLERLPVALSGFRTNRGANLLLISDPGRLALTDAHEHEDRIVAPPSRIMLDLFLEPRGDAAAEVFLSLWGEEEVEW